MKRTYRVWSAVCAALATAVMVCAGGPQTVEAKNDYAMTATLAESYTAEVGETLVIPLQVSSIYDMRGLGGTLKGQYDDTVLSFEKAEYTDGIPAGMDSSSEGNFGFITTGSFKSGTVNLEFQVLKCIKDPITVTIKDLYASVQESADAQPVSTDKITLTTKVTVNHPKDQREETVTKEATCTQKGTKAVKCKLCGTDLGTEEIPALGHDLGAATVIKAATCTETGLQEQKCSRCGETVQTEIPKTDHVSDEGRVTKKATCAEEGEKTYTCKTCGKVLKTEKIAKTEDHTWEITKDTDKDGWKVVTKASSTADGSKERVCKVCGKKETKTIAKITAGQTTTGTTTKTTTGKGTKTKTTTGNTATSGTSTGNTSTATTGTTATAAKTGDSTNVEGMLMAMLASAAVLAGSAGVMGRRRRKTQRN